MTGIGASCFQEQILMCSSARATPVFRHYISRNVIKLQALLPAPYECFVTLHTRPSARYAPISISVWMKGRQQAPCTIALRNVSLERMKNSANLNQVIRVRQTVGTVGIRHYHIRSARS